MECSGIAARSSAGLQRVQAIHSGIDRVVQIFAPGRPTHIVTPAQIRGRFDINRGVAALPAIIAAISIVVSDALAAAIKVFGLNRSGNRQRHAVERSFAVDDADCTRRRSGGVANIIRGASGEDVIAAKNICPQNRERRRSGCADQCAIGKEIDSANAPIHVTGERAHRNRGRRGECCRIGRRR